jgi:hypothetical protein
MKQVTFSFIVKCGIEQEGKDHKVKEEGISFLAKILTASHPKILFCSSEN